MNEEAEALLERWPLARNFQLSKGNIVLVVGAYKGLVIDLLDNLYPNMDIRGFEPQMWAAKEAEKRLLDKDNCFVYPFGLGVEPENGTARVQFGEWGTDACSMVNTGPEARLHDEGLIVDANWFLTNVAKLDHIDLMVMNIEGYEFQLLPYLKETGWLDKTSKLAVQFHLGFGNDSNYKEIIEALNSKFTLEFDKMPAWGYWVKNG